MTIVPARDLPDFGLSPVDAPSCLRLSSCDGFPSFAALSPWESSCWDLICSLIGLLLPG